MPILITDFDGTFARRDFFDLILERHDPPGARKQWRRFVTGELTLTEGLDAVFSALRTDDGGADALVTALDPAPGTAEAAKKLQAAGWEIVVASAGCGWYIDRLMTKLGLEIQVHASAGVFSPATGLVMHPDPQGPYFHPESGIDKAAVVRDALAKSPHVAYAGDSHTDRAGALLVPPSRRFVTGRLARQFVQEEVAHMAFAEWPEIAAHLLEADPDA